MQPTTAVPTAPAPGVNVRYEPEVKRVTNRRAYASLGIVGILALTGCGSTAPRFGPAGMGHRYAPLTCSIPADFPGAVVTVALADMGMSRMMNGTAPIGVPMQLSTAPASAPAGKATLVVTNRGWRTHELVVLPLAADSLAGQRVPGADGKVDETGSLGEASADCTSGTGEGVPAGSAGWVTLTLPPGRYELVCNLTNHYADGMYQEFTVTGS